MYMMYDGKYTHSIYEDADNSNLFFHVDSLAAPVVSLLNSFGYRTKFSCEGHASPYDIVLSEEENPENELVEGDFISLPYVTFEPNVKLKLKKHIPHSIGYIVYNKYIHVEGLGWVMSDEWFDEKELEDGDDFVLSIYLNSTETNENRPYEFYKRSLNKWEKLYSFLKKNLIPNKNE